MNQRIDGPTGLAVGEADAEQIATIEAEIDQTRNAITGDLRTIGERLSPEHLKAEAKQAVRNAKDAARESIREAKDNAMETVSTKVSELRDDVRQVEHQAMGFVRENALPLAMIGIGAVWLASNRRTRDLEWEGSYRMRDDRDWVYPEEEEEGGPVQAARRGVSHVADRVRDVAGREADRVRDFAGREADHARHMARDAEHRLSDAARGARHRAEREWRHARDVSQRTVETHPLAVGAAVMAAGIGIGLLLPSTRREEQLLGEARERLVGGAKEAVQDWTHAAKTAARDAKSTLTGNAI